MGGELDRMAHKRVGASEERPRILFGDCLLEYGSCWERKRVKIFFFLLEEDSELSSSSSLLEAFSVVIGGAGGRDVVFLPLSA